MAKSKQIFKKLNIFVIFFSGKDSKTLVVVQVSPATTNVSETLCSLQFAQRTRTVELGTPSKKVK